MAPRWYTPWRYCKGLAKLLAWNTDWSNGIRGNDGPNSSTGKTTGPGEKPKGKTVLARFCCFFQCCYFVLYSSVMHIPSSIRLVHTQLDILYRLGSVRASSTICSVEQRFISNFVCAADYADSPSVRVLYPIVSCRCIATYNFAMMSVRPRATSVIDVWDYKSPLG